MLFHAIQWRGHLFDSQSWSPGHPLPVWWPSGTHRAESSREPACQSPWAGGAPTPAQVRTGLDRRTCCRGSLRWEEPVNSAHQSRHLSISFYESKHVPVRNVKSATLLAALPETDNFRRPSLYRGWLSPTAEHRAVPRADGTSSPCSVRAGVAPCPPSSLECPQGPCWHLYRTPISVFNVFWQHFRLGPSE